MNRLAKIGLLIVTFSVVFLVTTAVLDWVCWRIGYYEQAAKEVIVFND